MPEQQKQRGIAVIGCGDMGSRHVQQWADRPDARVLAVYDPLPERAARAAEATGATAYPTAEAAILADGVEIVSVCTPVTFHAEHAVFAARHGRHVLSEKPIALTREQAEAMVAAARDAAVQLAVSYQYRALARNRKLREMVAAGEFGGPLFVRYTDLREVRPKLAMHRRSLNGGPLVDMAGHYFDLMRFFTGEEPVSVYAAGHVYGRGTQRLASIPEDDLAIDAATVEVRYGGGHILSAFVNWGMVEGFPGRSEEYFVGPRLTARTTGDGLELTHAEGREEWRPDTKDVYGPAARIADLLDALNTGRAPEVAGEDGIAALRVSLAALESIATGRAVDL